MKSRLFITTVTLMWSAMTFPSMAARSYIDLYGTPVAPSAATRAIVIRPDTKYVNVTGGDIVRFVVGDKTFAWQFNGAQTVGAFDLNEIAPTGVLDHTVRAYIDLDPRYL